MNIPSYFHPTSIMLVDDNKSFLSGLSLNLDDDLPYFLQNNPLKALIRLKEQYDQMDYCPTSDSLLRFLQTSQRFAQINVVVVDKTMPEICGIDFCKQLRSHSCKKILLTGTADAESALSAMREGVIDAYLKKSDEHAIEKLNLTVKSLQRKYFHELGASVPGHLVGRPDSSTEAFSQWFDELCNERNVVEYYFMPSQQEILLLDQYANLYGLILAPLDAAFADEGFVGMSIMDVLVEKKNILTAETAIRLVKLNCATPISAFNAYLQNL